MTSRMIRISMRMAVLGGAALIAAPALAADVVEPYVAPVAAPVIYDWTGPYIGVFAGGGWGDVDVFDNNGYNITGFSQNYDTSGFLGGVHVGYNWQSGGFVFGGEAELGYLGLDDSGQYGPYIGVRPGDSVASVESDLYASLTARAGYAFDNFLVYAKGGVAGLNTEVSFTDTNATGTTLVSGTTADEFLFGYTIGGGVEVGLSERLTLKAEYMFMDFEDISHTAVSGGGANFNFTHELDEIHTVKLGISYRW